MTAHSRLVFPTVLIRNNGEPALMPRVGTAEVRESA